MLSRKRETGKATPVKVWRFTDDFEQMQILGEIGVGVNFG
jgi:hypothetical protein